MYFSRIPESSSLIYRFCEFHNSSLFNSLQTNLWQRIRKAIDSTLALDDRVDLHSSPKGRFLLTFYLEQMSHVFKTNYIPIFDPEDFEPDIPESALPGDTPCPGQSFLMVFSAADVQVVTSVGFAQTTICVLSGH